MSKYQYQILQGVALINALSVTSRPVKWLRGDGDQPVWLDPKLARALVEHGVLSYEGKFRLPTMGTPHGRVHFIREYALPNPAIDTHFWDDRAVTHWHACQNAVPPINIRNQVTADLWDRMLNRPEKPKSWRRLTSV